MTATLPSGEKPVSNYSFRPYFLPNGVMLMKLTVKRGNEYVLVSGRVPRPGRKPKAEHFEEHVRLDDPGAVMAAILRAMSGTLGGHNPLSSKNPTADRLGQSISNVTHALFGAVSVGINKGDSSPKEIKRAISLAQLTANPKS